ncbi:DUF2809 domain-containing protein [Myceligenerans crystallogenes]|uniref:DUF2809 domain-containing protein n=1 Tax=Myceligenerans crystallogenes TaxID=316335 RepID=A0ABN2NA91_9MICO
MTSGVPRAVTALLLGGVVAAGLGARAVLPGAVGGPLGDALYATLVVLLIVFVRPRTSPAAAALAGFAICLAIELFQLTPVSAVVVAGFPPARYVLGTTFWAPDLVCYAAGAALGGILCRSATRRGAARGRVPSAP